MNAFASSGSIFFEEVIGEERNVFAALAQSGHANGNDVKAVIEVLAEGALSYLAVEISVGGCDDADVDGNFAGAADGTHGAFLQNAQQLDLHRHGHLADFVQKDGALVGDFEESAAILVGSGEGAFDVAEELAL